MQRNQELADFDIDLSTGNISLLEVSDVGADLLFPAELSQQRHSLILSRLVNSRSISHRRMDLQQILASYNAQSPTHLALMGHGLSLSDQYWYRAPDSTERWEDLNFFENEWDSSFGEAVLSHDYERLGTCSFDVPDVTTTGELIKAWECRDDGVFLIKESIMPDGFDLQGVKMASELCALLFDEDCYVPASIVERYGRPCAASPLMLASDEEFADGERLCEMAGIENNKRDMGNGSDGMREVFQTRIEAYAALGVPDASAHVAKMACLSCLSMLGNMHKENVGVIHAVSSDTWRAAPFFDYDGAFGFLGSGHDIVRLCGDPVRTVLLCLSRFSFLDSSWDWSWYDPQPLEGFEERIAELCASCRNLPPNYAELIVYLFNTQRDYVNKIALGKRG